jgi:hypothetical protein
VISPEPKITQIPSRRERFHRFLVLSAFLHLYVFGCLTEARATFHLWNVQEVYSSADGSVQFIELSTTTTFQNALSGHVITCTNSQGAHSFTFPTNLPTTATAGKTFIIGTSNLSSIPGGLVPNYVLTNTVPFLFQSASSPNTVLITLSLSANQASVYTALPTDGDLSLNGSGGTSIAATNTPKNFNDQSNTIVPVKIGTAKVIGTNFVLSFRTATGVNKSAGPGYAVDVKNSLSDPAWTAFATVPGHGSTKSATNALANSPQRFFRLHSP